MKKSELRPLQGEFLYLRLMEAAGYTTQANIAEDCFKVSPPTFSRWLNGENSPEHRNLVRAAHWIFEKGKFDIALDRYEREFVDAFHFLERVEHRETRIDADAPGLAREFLDGLAPEAIVKFTAQTAQQSDQTADPASQTPVPTSNRSQDFSEEGIQAQSVQASEFIENGIVREPADFIDPSGPWRINLSSQKPKAEDYNFLFLEAAGQNMNSDERFGVFISATLMEKPHSSGFAIGYSKARIAISIQEENSGIVKFNHYLRDEQVILDAKVTLVGDGPLAVIELKSNSNILNSRYELPDVVFTLQPKEENFALHASLFTLPADNTLRKSDGSELPSRVKSQLISMLIQKQIHPGDHKEGRMHLVHQIYEVEKSKAKIHE